MFISVNISINKREKKKGILHSVKRQFGQTDERRQPALST